MSGLSGNPNDENEMQVGLVGLVQAVRFGMATQIVRTNQEKGHRLGLRDILAWGCLGLVIGQRGLDMELC